MVLKKLHNSPISCKRDSTTLGRSMDNVSDALNLGQSYGGSEINEIFEKQTQY